MPNRKGKKGGWFGERKRHSEVALKGKVKKLLGNQPVEDDRERRERKRRKEIEQLRYQGYYSAAEELISSKLDLSVDGSPIESFMFYQDERLWKDLTDEEWDKVISGVDYTEEEVRKLANIIKKLMEDKGYDHLHAVESDKVQGYLTDLVESKLKREIVKVRETHEPVEVKEVKTVRDLQGDEYTLVNVDFEVEAIKDYIGLRGEQRGEYDSFLVKVGDGDYDEVWGIEGIVPHLNKTADRLW